MDIHESRHLDPPVVPSVSWTDTNLGLEQGSVIGHVTDEAACLSPTLPA
jgi:hypothetical protein